MIDALMALWNRHHRGHGIMLVLALLLIVMSISLAFTTFYTNASNPVVDHMASTPQHESVTATATSFAKSADVARIKTATPTVGVKKQQPVAQPCIAQAAQWSVTPVNSSRRRKKTPAAVTSTARSRLSPTPAVSPTLEPTETGTATLEPTPTAVPIEPTVTDEDTPTPEPTETGTPVMDSTPVATLPPERTVIVLITPTQAAMATSTPTPDLDDEKAALVPHMDHKSGAVAFHRHNTNCLSNSIGGPVDGGGMPGLAVNLAIVLGSVLPGMLLFYAALCGVYMLRQRRERRQAR
jgi:hypothetical protein